MSRSPLSPILRLVVAVSCLTCSNVGRAGDEAVVDDPYLVFVASDSAFLRCGPSGEYYRTDPLRHGQELEVYVETPDGWLGVRPTDESFCWIVADAVKLMSSPSRRSGAKPSSGETLGKAEVIENRTVAWIGTNLGRAKRYRWQVQLGEGEIVTVLGASERDGASGPQTWYRIVPPSGEFRWIHRDQVVLTAEALLAAIESPTSDTDAEFLPGEDDFIDDPELNARWAEQERAEGRARMDQLAAWRTRQRDDAQRAEAEYDEISQEDAADERSVDADAHHHPQSFSQRVAGGLSVLINGRDAMPDLKPVTPSSRRVPDLVPIADSPVTRSSDRNQPSLVGSGIDELAIAPELKVAQLDPPVIMEDSFADTTAEIPRTQVSPMSIASRPRVVPQTEAVPLRSSAESSDAWGIRQTAADDVLRPEISTLGLGNTSSRTPLPPLPGPVPVRTITSEQIDEVRRELAAADAGSLSMILSKLMSRAASAPEIGLVAEAAERLDDPTLATRARQYEALARRRDGDTIVRTPTQSTPTIPAPLSQLARATSQSMIAPVATHPPIGQPIAHDLPTIVPASGPPQHQGVLVEVYSADPNRPPFALTDRGGRTMAYVTPAPGVNLKSHLGTEIRIIGESGYLRGLETPHILAVGVER